jgi:hypothetical protein
MLFTQEEAMGLRRQTLSAVISVSIFAVCSTLLAPAAQAVGHAAPADVNPSALERGPDPGVAHIVYDVLRDGGLRISLPKSGGHDALWEVAGGYVVRDVNVGARRATRVLFVADTGERRVMARSRSWVTVAVSADGRRVAYQRTVTRTGERTLVAVENPRSGRVVAQRVFRLANLVALDGSRVLLGVRLNWRDPASVWWRYETDFVRRWHGQAAVSADVTHDKVVFDRPSAGEFCIRVARLSRPHHTLWRSCKVMPHQWSPDGSRTLATHTYFDARGTNRWWVLAGSSPVRQAAFAGRLDWHAVWEDDTHFLTLAQGTDGQAAIVRCDVAGACERASRTWTRAFDPDLYYTPPPVVLAEHG